MSIEEVRQKGEAAQANAERYRRLADNPNLSFWARYAAQQLARSYAAAVKLARKALAYEIEKAGAGDAPTGIKQDQQLPPYKVSPPLTP